MRTDIISFAWGRRGGDVGETWGRRRGGEYCSCRGGYFHLRAGFVEKRDAGALAAISKAVTRAAGAPVHLNLLFASETNTTTLAACATVYFRILQEYRLEDGQNELKFENPIRGYFVTRVADPNNFFDIFKEKAMNMQRRINKRVKLSHATSTAMISSITSQIITIHN